MGHRRGGRYAGVYKKPYAAGGEWGAICRVDIQRGYVGGNTQAK